MAHQLPEVLELSQWEVFSVLLCHPVHFTVFPPSILLPPRSNRARLVRERARYCSITSRLVWENFIFQLNGCETCVRRCKIQLLTSTCIDDFALSKNHDFDIIIASSKIIVILKAQFELLRMITKLHT